MNHPCSSEGRLTFIEQVLTIVHKQNFVFLEGIVEIRWGIVNAAFSRISQNLRSNVALFDDFVYGWAETWVYFHYPLTTRKDFIITEHPRGVIEQQFDTNYYILRA